MVARLVDRVKKRAGNRQSEAQTFAAAAVGIGAAERRRFDQYVLIKPGVPAAHATLPEAALIALNADIADSLASLDIRCAAYPQGEPCDA